MQQAWLVLCQLKHKLDQLGVRHGLEPAPDIIQGNEVHQTANPDKQQRYNMFAVDSPVVRAGTGGRVEPTTGVFSFDIMLNVSALGS